MHSAHLVVRSILCVFAVLISNSVLAGHAPTIFYAGNSGYVSTYRFSTPEEAGRWEVESRGFSTWRYTHIEPYTSGRRDRFRVYYMLRENNGTESGPYVAAHVDRYWACDLTPNIYGVPKDHTYYRDHYPSSGCPTPEASSEKIGCNDKAGTCGDLPDTMIGNPISIALMAKIQTETDYGSPGEPSLDFTRRYYSDGFSDDAYLSNRPMGSRWRHNHERAVLVQPYGTLKTAAVVRPDGRVLKFSLIAGAWTPDTDVEDTLVQLSDGSGALVG